MSQPKVTLEQAKLDLAQTNRDIEYLTNIIENLRLFIQNDDCRERYRMKLMSFEVTLAEGENLKTKIETVIQSLTN